MLLFALLVLHVALSMGRLVETRNYALTIDENTLKDIRIIGKSPDELNLSNLGLEAIDKGAFAHLSNLKSLNLSNNSLKSLPEFALANLTNLENLDLANNHLDSGKFYVGLSSLKTLNISNNLVHSFEAGHFFGLTKSINIYTQENNVSTINAAMFENPSTIISRPTNPLIMEPYGYSYGNGIFEEHVKNSNSSNQNSNGEVKVCIENDHLKSVEAIKKDEVLPQDCHEVSYDDNSLRLSSGVRTFENGWYRLQDQNVNSIYLEYKGFAEITKELLNNLPANIRGVCLLGNRIEKLERGVIEKNNGIVALVLGWNHISEIENGALENLTRMNWLALNHNRLKNTKFLDSLPLSIQTVTLYYNEISDISAGNFSKFTNFHTLTLSLNNITEIKAQRLRGFSSLKALILSKVNLKKIEPGAFQDLKNLATLDISKNQISSLQEGTFSGLDNINHILLDDNKLKDISNNVFNAIPNSLRVLSLSSNEIESVKAGTFVNAPTIWLDLTRNRISTIEKGAFNLPSLRSLLLHKNLLNDVDGDSFEGLENLSELSLGLNGITKIKKGLAKKMSKLYILTLSYNPIRVLENGSLFGLSKMGTKIELDSVPVEIIQGALFDDV